MSKVAAKEQIDEYDEENDFRGGTECEPKHWGIGIVVIVALVFGASRFVDSLKED